MHSTGTHADAKKHSREGQKQREIIFKCLPGQVVLKNQWLRITKKKKKGKCETGMTQLGNDRRERPADRSRRTIHESERRGERGENKRGTHRQGNPRAIIQDDK